MRDITLAALDLADRPRDELRAIAALMRPFDPETANQLESYVDRAAALAIEILVPADKTKET